MKYHFSVIQGLVKRIRRNCYVSKLLLLQNLWNKNKCNEIWLTFTSSWIERLQNLGNFCGFIYHFWSETALHRPTTCLQLTQQTCLLSFNLSIASIRFGACNVGLRQNSDMRTENFVFGHCTGMVLAAVGPAKNSKWS